MKDLSTSDLSWIKRGKQRRDILPCIATKETPTEIAQKANYSLNHTSRILNEFRRKGLVRLINPKQKTGRLYELTEKGKIVRDALKKT